jgi:hypothetical protein
MLFNHLLWEKGINGLAKLWHKEVKIYLYSNLHLIPMTSFFGYASSKDTPRRLVTSDWSHESRRLQGISWSKYTETPPPEDPMRSLRNKLNPGIDTQWSGMSGNSHDSVMQIKLAE